MSDYTNGGSIGSASWLMSEWLLPDRVLPEFPPRCPTRADKGRRMPISVTCASCGRRFKVDAQYAGKKGRCPNADCKAVFVVPKVESPAADDDWDAFSSEPAEKKSRRPMKSVATQNAGRGPKPNSKSVAPARKPRSVTMMAVGLVSLVALGAIGWLIWSGGDTNGGGAVQALASEPQETVPTFAEHALPFLKKHCYECHQGEEPEAGILFTKFSDDTSVMKSRKLFQRALDLVQQGLMPPQDVAQPTEAEKLAFGKYLERTLYFVDCSQGVDPGRVTIRRLNRLEYNQTVRDLLGINFRPADDFPSDDVGYGFDNIGDVLSLPPLLMEKYLNAADTIAQQVIVVPNPKRLTSRMFGPEKLERRGAVNDSGDNLAIVSDGAVIAKFEANVGGKYILRARASGQRAGNEQPKMRFSLDGKSLKVFDVTTRGNRSEEYDLPLTLTRGAHVFDAAFINDFYDEAKKEDRNLFVSYLEVLGPLEIDTKDLGPIHQELTARRPGADRTVNVAVRENLKPFLLRAFRRPVQDHELDGYVRLVERSLQEGVPFEEAMQRTLMAVLVSPHFLFRVETDRNPNDPKDRHPLNDYELANRLSYFLWSSMPDEELFGLAERNELHTDLVLESQVKRMLRDPRGQALIDSFGEQWLQLRVLEEVAPDPQKFPDFSESLRHDMREETKRLFGHVMREDLSIMTFLDAKFTFVNERLAKHYGFSGVSGSEFQRVSLEGTPRSGMLTHASILTMTSNPDRTSPVKRGKWIMEVVLNSPPPPPPPNAPDLTEAKAPAGASLRQQLEIHRANATCASCHRTMDDLGFGLENFDAIGRWRDQDQGQPLDTSGELPGGLKFRGSQEMAKVLTIKSHDFARAMIDAMLTYALGRPLEYYDRCTQNALFEKVRERDFRFSAIVHEITKSEAFRMRRGEEAHRP